jgi:hypothetical protein
MKISTLLIVSLLGFSTNLVSAKEISPFMLSNVHDQAFSMHISTPKIDSTSYSATLADSLRVLAVDISMDKVDNTRLVNLKTR